ncbi:hypothetical protein GCM10027160_27930 [Streptomyces calidiresistens]|uniref:Uncharacterized protein n=1 Tax=Streptomyces calidiresistens TaxID=1485586 RepID=A0A7W3XZB7_9ACTN|nr:hypothetical protein [Streptomyces calidiresistens]MBB0232686.1 hypothetical protein [Streptomyces calidiresistens]
MPERAGVSVEYPAPWFGFPLDPGVDVDRWAGSKAEELLLASNGEDVPEITRVLRPRASDLRAELGKRARAYRQRGPAHALGCYPPGVDTSDVGMEISRRIPAGCVDPARPAGGVAVHDAGEPLVEEGGTGAGPLTRIRWNARGERRPWFGGRPVIRALTHVIRPRATTVPVVAHTVWTDPGLDEYIEPWADGIAETIRVTSR